MAQRIHYSGNTITVTEDFAASGGTTTLPAPGAGMHWRIDHIAINFVTACTVWAVDVQENGGASCYKIGLTSAAVPGFVPGPIATKVNDAPKVVLSSTGATASVINVIATLVAGGA